MKYGGRRHPDRTVVSVLDHPGFATEVMYETPCVDRHGVSVRMRFVMTLKSWQRWAANAEVIGG